jgi:hypothetical protein
MIEQRRFARCPIDQELSFILKGEVEPRRGVGKDIAVGGMFIVTALPLPPFGAEVTVITRLPGGGATEFRLPGVIRWMRPDGMGVQFGMLGARETHLITEVARNHEAASQAK